MANLTDIVKAKLDKTDAGQFVAGDPNLQGYWSDLTGTVLEGERVTYLEDTWEALTDIADVTLSEPTTSNTDWYKRQEEMFSYAVSQLASGVSSDVGYLLTGEEISDYTYLVYPDDGRIYEVGTSTGIVSGDFDPATGLDSGFSAAIVSTERGDSSTLDIATSAEIIAGSVGKVITVDELASSFIINDETKADLYSGSSISPTIDATNTNDTDYDQYVFIQFTSSTGGNANAIQISTDGGSSWVNFGHSSAFSGISNQITVRPGWAWRVRYSYSQVVEISV